MTQTVTQRAAAATTQPAAFAGAGGGMSINQIYEQAGPGVVDIVVTSDSGSDGSLFGGGQQMDEGAGVVYDDHGDILTDQHVVAHAKSIKVTFQDGLVASAKLVGTDPSTDVGVIKVAVSRSELHPLRFADSSAAQVGDNVIAIGSPFSLPETVTAGIVSQTGRSIQAPNGFQIPGAIQTDAAINPGNSGGPLLDADGQVLGLNDQIETDNTSVDGQGSSSGIGFATPGNEDTRVANTLISGQQVKHAYLGIAFPGSVLARARVTCVQPQSPAAAAGLRDNDVITALDSKQVSSANQFVATLLSYAPGQTVTLTVQRQGHAKQITVHLGSRPTRAPMAC